MCFCQYNHFTLLFQEIRPDDANKMCIVIDLDETLVHSSFKVSALTVSWSLGILISKLGFHNNQRGISFQPISNADFIVPVEIDGTIHQVYVLKRPHVDEFLCKMGELFECVLFTASLAKVSETSSHNNSSPLLFDILDIQTNI